MVKLIFAFVALATAFAASSAQAQAYDPRYPVCIHFYGSLEGDRIDCTYTSLPQCRATASGHSATCDLNPYFAPAQVPRRRY